jgi:hypothetical protein
MTVEIGNKATQFPEKEYINGIFFAVQNYALRRFANLFKFSFFYINKLLFSKKVISLIV